MNTKPLIFVPLFLFASSLMLLSQEELGREMRWEDERICITLEKLTRVDSFPEELRDPGAEYKPPKQGNDLVLIHIGVVEKTDLKVKPTELFIAPPNSPHLTDDQGKTHWAAFAQYSLAIGKPTLFGRGGYMVFEMPKEATPVQLTFVYPYREGSSQEKKTYAQLDIDLTDCQ